MAELTIDEPRLDGERLELSARFAWASGRHRLWYRVECERQNDLVRNADPFVIGFVHLAMTIGENVLVCGDVSPSLLQNLEAFQQAWSAWKPRRYRPVEIRAEAEVEPGLTERRGAISGFSGGVDSCFTAFRHARAVTTRFPFPLRASVMVHGFDIPLDDGDGYSRATEKAQRQLDGLGLDLYRVATSFQEQPVDWVDSFGAGLASVLALFQGRFRSGLIAQGVPYDSYRSLVEGSNPLTDPLLSSDAFEVVPDGAGFSRIDKIAALANWSVGFDDLRVCWRNEVRDENCCVCEKCIRNILSFRALGLEPPASFPLDVSDEQVRGLVPLTEQKINVGYEPIARLAESRGIGDAPWVRTLRRTIVASRRYRNMRTIRGGMRVWRLAHRLGLMG